MSDPHKVYRLLCFDTLRFHSGLETRGRCTKLKTAYTRGRRSDPMVAYYRVRVGPVKVDPEHPRRLTQETVDAINSWREYMGKKRRPVTVRSRTKEPRHYHMSTA